MIHRAQVAELSGEGCGDCAGVVADIVGGVRWFGDNLVRDAFGEEVVDSDVLPGGQVGGVMVIAVDDGAGAFQRERGEPGVLGGDDAVGGE